MFVFILFQCRLFLLASCLFSSFWAGGLTREAHLHLTASCIRHWRETPENYRALVWTRGRSARLWLTCSLWWWTLWLATKNCKWCLCVWPSSNRSGSSPPSIPVLQHVCWNVCGGLRVWFRCLRDWDSCEERVLCGVILQPHEYIRVVCVVYFIWLAVLLWLEISLASGFAFHVIVCC